MFGDMKRQGGGKTTSPSTCLVVTDPGGATKVYVTVIRMTVSPGVCQGGWEHSDNQHQNVHNAE